MLEMTTAQVGLQSLFHVAWYDDLWLRSDALSLLLDSLQKREQQAVQTRFANKAEKQ